MKRALIVVVLLAACRRDMYDRPARRPLGATEFFPDRSASRPIVPDTVPRETEDREPRTEARGRERYAIYCAPCHGVRGDGDGVIVRHGFPQPPSLYSARVVALSDAGIVRTIVNGSGDMASYADRVPENDRWAIAAYVRAMQRQRNVYR